MSLDTAHDAALSSEAVGIAQRSPVVGAPWFVQFWPVFIAVLMILSIAASLSTVVIAYRHADVDVRSFEPAAPVDTAGRETAGSSSGAFRRGAGDSAR